VQGEGDYKSARVYRRTLREFIQKKGGEIPKIGEGRGEAVEGPEGAELAKAERRRANQGSSLICHR